jgi:prepilin-type processing-associated H-X9-DG protein
MSTNAHYNKSAFTLIESLLVIGIFLLLISLSIPAIQRVRGLVDQVKCQARLRQIGGALTQHVADRRTFPPAANLWAGPLPYLSWQARILPYIHGGNVWNATISAFAIEPAFWRGPHIPIRSTVVAAYLCPSDRECLGVFENPSPPAAFTHYLAVSGDKYGTNTGVMFPYSRTQPAEVFDGLSNTLIVGERPASSNGRYGWWYAGIGQNWDSSLDSHMAVRQLNQSAYAPTCSVGPYPFQRGRQDDICSTFHFWSLHPGGAHFLFADGSVRFLKYSADAILPALATRAGKEPASLPE